MCKQLAAVVCHLHIQIGTLGCLLVWLLTTETQSRAVASDLLASVPWANLPRPQWCSRTESSLRKAKMEKLREVPVGIYMPEFRNEADSHPAPRSTVQLPPVLPRVSTPPIAYSFLFPQPWIKTTDSKASPQHTYTHASALQALFYERYLLFLISQS